MDWTELPRTAKRMGVPKTPRPVYKGKPLPGNASSEKLPPLEVDTGLSVGVGGAEQDAYGMWPPGKGEEKAMALNARKGVRPGDKYLDPGDIEKDTAEYLAIMAPSGKLEEISKYHQAGLALYRLLKNADTRFDETYIRDLLLHQNYRLGSLGYPVKPWSLVGENPGEGEDEAIAVYRHLLRLRPGIAGAAYTLPRKSK